MEERDQLRPDRRGLLLEAIRNPTRARILAILSDREASAKELAEEISEPPPKIRYHLRFLREIGLVDADEIQRRGVAEFFYRPTTMQLTDEAEFAELGPPERRQLCAFILRLIFNDATNAMRRGAIDSRDDFALVRMRLEVDERGWRDLTALNEDVLEKVQRVKAESRERLREKASDSLTASWALLCLEMPPPSHAYP